MKFDRHISESAFLVNESRARNVELSRDRYARLWVSDSTRRLWEDFSREVYPHDAIELALRNRFFLECLNSYLNSSQATAFVNIGAGFTSYPFLTDKPCRCIEVDYAHVIEYKRQRIAQWQDEGLLPKRDIDFLAADLTDEKDVEALTGALNARLNDRPSFILMEGLTYYLQMDVLRRLLDAFSKTQVDDSILAFDFWTPDTSNHPIFARLRKFWADRFGQQETSYNLFDVDFAAFIPGYDVVEVTTIQELEKVFSNTTFLANYDEIIPENYAVLRKVTQAAQPV